MKATGLPARIVYTVVLTPLTGLGIFHASMLMLPNLASRYPQLDTGIEGFGIFKVAVSVAVAAGFMVGLVALTLPWVRHRKRSGRTMRIAFCSVFVVVASVSFAVETYGQRYSILYGLAFAAWLTYAVAFTIVRYGLVDDAQRPSSSSARY